MPHIGYFWNPLDWFEATPTDGETKKGPNSNWAFDHKANPNAHHAKYTDAEAKAAAAPMPLSIGPMAFMPVYDTDDFQIDLSMICKNTGLDPATFNAPVYFPHGATVTKLTLVGYRDDAAATLILRLRRTNDAGTTQLMAEVFADWTIGDSSGYDDTIDYATIDNVNWRYYLTLVLDPNDQVTDVRMYRVVIEWS